VLLLLQLLLLLFFAACQNLRSLDLLEVGLNLRLLRGLRELGPGRLGITDLDFQPPVLLLFLGLLAVVFEVGVFLLVIFECVRVHF